MHPPTDDVAQDDDPDHWVARRREHRQGLSQAAQDKWDAEGTQAHRAYLDAVRTALEAEGYRSSLLQWRHKGHAFGLIKDLGDKQIHVRVYDDGVIDAELEIHKRYLEHLWSPRPSAHNEIQALLDKHGLPTELVNEQYLPQVGALRERFPERRTHVGVVAGAAATVVGGLVVASMARMRFSSSNLARLAATAQEVAAAVKKARDEATATADAAANPAAHAAAAATPAEADAPDADDE